MLRLLTIKQSRFSFRVEILKGNQRGVLNGVNFSDPKDFSSLWIERKDSLTRPIGASTAREKFREDLADKLKVGSVPERACTLLGSKGFCRK